VLDMRAPGQGASQASAGMLAPYIEAHGSARLLQLGVRSLGLFDEFIASLNDEAPPDRRVEYRRTGTLEVALDSDGLDGLRAMNSALNRIGVECALHDGPSVRELEPSLSPSALGGLFVPSQGFVAVRPLIQSLVYHARQAGAVFVSPVEAALVASQAASVAVKVGDETYSARYAVIAAGSWSRRVRIANAPALPVRPVRGQLLQLHWCESDQPRRVIWGPDCYVVPWADGSVLVGATMEDVGFDEGTTVGGVQALTSAVSDLLPHASGARLEQVRVGLRPALPDGLPAIGPFATAPNVIAATGHFRNGVLLSALTATVVSRLVLEGEPDEIFEFTTPDRFGSSKSESADSA
jgi:glycine oxidase